MGNEYAGSDGFNSKKVNGEVFEGGVTNNGKHISMNHHDEKGDIGNYEDAVAHEIGHLFGLDDEGGGPYYGGDGGIMEYKGLDLSDISDNDVKTILKFAKDALNGKTKDTDPKVIIIDQKGQSSGDNPIGITN